MKQGASLTTLRRNCSQEMHWANLLLPFLDECNKSSDHDSFGWACFTEEVLCRKLSTQIIASTCI